MLTSARFFLCALCHQQCVVCRGCDRGQLYCSKVCSDTSRVERQREANRRYASTQAGRHNNAKRQSEFRARQRAKKDDVAEKVTDQGSADHKLADTLERDRSDSINKPNKHQPTDMRCHFCSQCCDPLLRSDFLRPAQRHRCYAPTQHDTIP
jgi:hypothetical protein